MSRYSYPPLPRPLPPPPDPPPPPDDDKDTGVRVRDGGGFARRPLPRTGEKCSVYPPQPPKNHVFRGGRKLKPHEIPPMCGESRYRVARKGNLFRVEEWRRLWRIGPYGWRAVPYASGDVMSVDTTETDPITARQRLARLRANEAGPATWQPVADDFEVGAGEG